MGNVIVLDMFGKHDAGNLFTRYYLQFERSNRRLWIDLRSRKSRIIQAN